MTSPRRSASCMGQLCQRCRNWPSCSGSSSPPKRAIGSLARTSAMFLCCCSSSWSMSANISAQAAEYAARNLEDASRISCRQAAESSARCGCVRRTTSCARSGDQPGAICSCRSSTHPAWAKALWIPLGSPRSRPPPLSLVTSATASITPATEVPPRMRTMHFSLSSKVTTSTSAGVTWWPASAPAITCMRSSSGSSESNPGNGFAGGVAGVF
mmetsp:Transcript_160372/g.292866  ORF Transcript_160372/g.292866 Transcript_160372/m.292866 type:complete len:213 (-) Transcript_160372:377-1015(-)